MPPQRDPSYITDEVIISMRRAVKMRPGTVPYSLMVASLSVSLGARIGLVGLSGSGKSTLLDMLALVLSPDRVDRGGELTWRPGSFADTVDLWKDWRTPGSSVRERSRRRELGYVLQSGGLLPFMSVGANIKLPALLKKQPKGAELEDRLHKLADYLKIRHLLPKLPGSISVGERQRAAVAGALIHSPLVILADEPTASLDPITAERVFELFLELAGKSGAAIVLATHNREQAERYGFLIHTVEVASERGRITARLHSPEAPEAPQSEGGLVVVKASDPGA